MKMQFGTSYKFYQMKDAEKKLGQLQRRKIDAAIETSTGSGMATVMSYIVHTDEKGTKDLTDFRNRSKK